MEWLVLLAALLIVGAPVAGGVLARRGPAAAAGRVATASGVVALVTAGLLLALVAVHGRAVAQLPLGHDPAIGVTLLADGISATVALLVSFIGWVVLRFSRRHLAGEPREPFYYSWLCFTLAAVLALVLAGNLLVLLLAWIATSTALHQLLLHYRERPAAWFAARKKFVISRLGDLSLIGALILIWRECGTWDLTALFAHAASGADLSTACVLLALGAAMKSAQVPFHSWLPDTLETPTPVSALMHAGIINAGGYLIIRLSPLFVHATAALTLLAIVGAVTAAFGAIVMLTQPTVKRSLAYSTIGQMGFMLLECGLGAFGLALVHLCAHAVYKAHAFLSAGSTVGTLARRAVPLRPRPALAAGAVALALTTAAILLGGPLHRGELLLFAIAGLSVAYGLARYWSVLAHPGAVARGVGLTSLLLALLVVLHAAVAPHFPTAPTLPSSVLIFVALVFLGLLILQAGLGQAVRFPALRSFYVHVLNGFYLGTFANRLLRRLWPKAVPAA